MRVDDYVGRRRDSVAENELARALRALPSEDAYAFIVEYIERDLVVGLVLAKRVLTKRDQFEAILRRGFQRANVSSIWHWLDACTSRIGPSRVMTMFETLADESPETAARLYYWTRILLRKADPRLASRLADVARRLAQ